MSLHPQLLLDTHEELIIDLFAGGGGASSGIEQATGRMVDIAINHDQRAVAMHQANHPTTYHLVTDVFEVNPHIVCRNRPVAFLWASPDCTFHSKARGGKPIRSKTKKRRALAWVVTRWAGQVRPRVIMLENVEEFAQWGPLVGPPDQLRPCKKRRGQSFRKWVKSLTGLGYEVEWRELRACDYGAPTIRKRLYLIARCDGQPIVWPQPTHGVGFRISEHRGEKVPLKPFRTAAECIDFSIPMLSIFATREKAKAWGKNLGQAAPIRPLAENTQRRIARGVKRFVLDNPKPFLVTLNHGGEWQRGWSLQEPMKTLTAARDAHAVVSPVIAGVGGRAGQSPERSVTQPMATITAKGDAAIIAPFAVPRYGEREGQEPRCASVEDPAPVVVPSGNGANLVAANLVSYHDEQGAEARANSLDQPIHTIDTANRHGLVASFLAQNNGGFYEGGGRELTEPVSTILTQSRGHHGLIAAHVSTNRNNDKPFNGCDEPMSTITAVGAGKTLVAGTLIEQHGTAHAEDIEKPLQTISAGGQHHGVVAAHLQQDYGQSVGSNLDDPARTVTGGGGGHANLVATFMAKYYGTGVGQDVTEPVHTVPTVDRFGVVTVKINGQEFVLEDIAMRMLQPKELYLAQGFRASYIIDRGCDGKPITKTEQVRMVGNSVSPPVAEALVTANCQDLVVRRKPMVVRERPRRLVSA